MNGGILDSLSSNPHTPMIKLHPFSAPIVFLSHLTLFTTTLLGGPAVLLKDIYPGFGSTGSNTTELTVVGDDLYCIAGNQIRRTSGVTGETSVAATNSPGTLGQLAAAGSKAGFILSGTNASDATELYVIDGSSSGTVRQATFWDPYLQSSGYYQRGTPYRLNSLGSSAFYFVDYPNSNSRSLLYRVDGDSGQAWSILISGSLFSSNTPVVSSAVAGDTLHFVAHASDYYALYRTDGTAPGTKLVKSATNDFANPFMDPQTIAVMGGTAYFHFRDSTNGDELWKSDGTNAGTVMVADIRPGAASSMNSLPSAAVMNGYLYFAANNGTNGSELWRTDGTTTGTTMVKDINPGSAASSPTSFTVVGSTLYFSAITATNGRELWRSDGTSGGTELVLDIAAGTTSSIDNTPAMTSYGGYLYFAANNVTNGKELWRSDGTAGGTTLVQDLRIGTAGSSPASFVEYQGDLHFIADDGKVGKEVWKTNGVSSPVLLNLSGENSGDPANFTLMPGGFHLFTATDADGTELWRTDGTELGTFKVKDVEPGAESSSLDQFRVFGNKMFFRAQTAASGQEPWITDGTEEGTLPLADIVPGTNSSSPTAIAEMGSYLFFDTSSSTSGLFRTDGTPAGTVRLTNDSASNGVVMGSHYYFSYNDGVSGQELWKTDGTPAGTVLVKDIRVGSSNSSPGSLFVHQGTLFFTAADSGSDFELWKSDGTANGTVRVKDINTGTSGASIQKFYSHGSTLYFTAFTAAGRELWKTDGTETGTVMVADLSPGSASTSFGTFFAFANKLVFFASNPTYGGEYWTTDGTAEGTVPIKDIRPGSGGSSVNYLMILADAFYFEADDGTHGKELWRSDGTEAGTYMVKNIVDGNASGTVRPTHAAGGYVYMHVYGPINGWVNSYHRLWRTDGTEAGTEPVINLETGQTYLTTGSLSPSATSGDKLYFSASSIERGSELWLIEPDAAHARPVSGFHPGMGNASIGFLGKRDDKLLLKAFSPGVGRELYLMDPDTPQHPYASTQAVINIGTTSATLQGLVFPDGQAMTAAFDYGISMELGSSVPIGVNPAGGTEPQTVTHVLNGLTPGTTYFYRMRGTSAAGTDYGGIRSFRTISSNAALATITAGSANLTPSFSPHIQHYTAEIAATASSVIVWAESADADAMVSINGATAGKRARNAVISVNPAASSVVTIEVTAADGTTSQSYTLTISRGSAPEIGVTGNGINLSDNDNIPDATDGTNYGSVDIGASANNTFVITNLGDQTLTISTPVVAGSHPGDFSFSQMPSPVLESGENTTLGIAFAPTVAGQRNATISFANNDGDENPFNFSIRGNGTIPPVITFPELPHRTGSLEPITLAATANNGQSIQYAILSGSDVATLSGNIVSLTGIAGSVTVVARQAENGGFAPAPPVYRTFTVSLASPFVSFAQGCVGTSNFGLRADGTLWSWGGNSLGKLGLGTSSNSAVPQQVPSSLPWLTAAQGGSHVLAIKSDGTLWSWGSGLSGQLGGGTTPIVQSSPLQVGAVTNWQSVAAGTSHSLAIRNDGTLWAWGTNSDGRLGDGTTTQRTTPVQIGTDANWSKVSAGMTHSMALKTNGTLWTWDGVSGTPTTPGQVGSDTAWVKISAGRTHFMAIKSNGTLWAWGDNTSGQLGDGTVISRSSPVQIGSSTDWQSVSAGGIFTLAIKTDGSLWSWGSNGNGELGVANITESLVPVQIASAGAGWLGVVANNSHAIGLKIDGSVWAWGRGFEGQLASISTPVAIPLAGETSGWAMLATGQSHSAALGHDGRLWCWGSNSHGQLGDGSLTRRIHPVVMGPDSDWEMVSAGRVHTMAIKTNGTLWAWGDNSSGQFGNGGNTGTPNPVQIGTDTDWKSVSTTDSHTLAIKTNGTLWAWGDNTYGQLGNGTLVSSMVPVQIGSATTWESVSASSSFDSAYSLARMSNGTIWSWGHNQNGQLGLGNTTQRTSPAQIGTANHWQKIRAGGTHSVAITTSGQIWVWGRGNSGQIGDGATSNRTSPVQVGAGTTWQDATAGTSHTLGLAEDGTIWAWGFNGYGSLGDATHISRTLPVIVGSSAHWSMPVSSSQSSHTLVLRGKQLWGIGNNSSGQVPGGEWGRFSPRISVPQRSPQSIEFPTPDSSIGVPVELQASASSGLPVQYSVTGPATLSGQTLTIQGPGEVRLDAWQSGDDSAWLPSQPVMRILNEGIAIPDSNLLTALLDALGKTAGPITSADMLSLTHLNLANLGITHLSGLETAANLRILDIRRNAFGDAAALWAILDQLTLYCLYTDVPRPGANPPGLLTETVTDTSGAAFYITVDAQNLPTLDISGLGIDTTVQSNLNALQVFADAGVTVEGLPENQIPQAVAQYEILDPSTGQVLLDASASSDPDGTITSYEWSWTGGSAAGVTTTVTLPSGTTVVTLTVTDNRAASHSTSLAVRFASAGDDIFTLDPAFGDLTEDGLGGFDTVVFPPGVRPQDLELIDTSGPDFFIQVGGTGSLQLSNFERLQFADGTILSLESIGEVMTWGTYLDESLTSPGPGQDSDLAQRVSLSVQPEFGPPSLESVIAVDAGGGHSLAVSAFGRVFAWGRNHRGQFGDGTTVDNTSPQQVDPSGVLSGKRVIAVAAGEDFSLALTDEGRVYAWGANQLGQLGNGTTIDSPVPVEVDASGALNGKIITQIAAGYGHAHALASDGTVFSWGENSFGQLGIGSVVTPVPVPTVVVGTGALVGTSVNAIAAGHYHSLALGDDGHVYAWGSGGLGQLGDGGATISNVPVAVDRTGPLAGQTVSAIAAGGHHSLAATSTGDLVSWGLNHSLQLGIPGGGIELIPVAVPLGGAKVTKLAAGSLHSVALTNDGKVISWGGNNIGQLGIGESGADSLPVPVEARGWLAGRSVREIAAGNQHSIALTDSVYLEPDIEVRGGGGLLLNDGPGLILPSTVMGQTSEDITLGVFNNGRVPLGGFSVSLSGDHPGDFDFDEMLTELAFRDLAEIPVRFQPQAAGLRQAVLEITSNDPNESPFLIRLAGSGGLIFGDANLEVAIRAALAKPTGPITAADMLTLTNLNLAGLGITGLGGLEFANNLRILDIRGNPFTDAAATWAILDQLPLYCLYTDLQRPGGNPPGLLTETLTTTGGGAFYILVDPLNLPILDISGLNIDTTNPANLAALDVFANAGISIETGATNLPPAAIGTATVTNELTGATTLDGSASRDIDGTITAWNWTWAGGSATGSTASASFPAGTTIVTLTVTDNDGATASITMEVVVEGPAGDLYLWAAFSGQPGGWGNADGTGAAARFDSPGGIVSDNNGGFFVADSNNHVIRRVSATGMVTSFAGSTQMFGSSDGTGSAASFRGPTGLAMKPDGFLVVADTQNSVIRQISPSGEVTLVAGSPGAVGSQSGTGSGARFFLPRAVAVDPQMNIYVADSNNHTIRKIDITGEVTLFAGAPGQVGGVNGPKLNARFNNPRGIAVDPGGMVYVAEWGSHTLRRIDPAGNVTTLAGMSGASGSTDGAGPGARFNRPWGMAFDLNGNLLVADTDNHLIRRVTPGGTVSTLAGSPLAGGDADGIGSTARFSSPQAVCADVEGIHVADSANSMVRKINSAMEVTTLAGTSPKSGIANGDLASARYRQPGGGVFDAAGNLYIADTGSHHIRKIQPDGTVSVLAGGGVSGFVNGLGTAARFNQPTEIVLDPLGNLLVSDKGNNRIRKITLAGEVTTHAGTGQSGSTDGAALTARFFNPHGMVFDSQGNLFIADFLGHIIRKLDTNGNVTTFAGTAGQNGSTDGTGAAARFIQPAGLAIDPSDNLYVANAGGHTIRKITPAGEVTTLAGSSGVWGGTDGTGAEARFWSPRPIVWHPAGYLIAADWLGHTIRRIDPSGEVTTIGGLSGAGTDADGYGLESRFSRPAGIVIRPDHSLLVMDSYNNRLVTGVNVTGVPNDPPVAGASATVLDLAARSVLLDGGGSSDADGSIVSWAWTWPGGSAAGASITVTLPAGLTTITLNVTDDDGASAATTVSVTLDPGLSAAFSSAGLTGSDALPDAQPFNDGVPNLLKYAFNMNLAGPDTSKLPPGTGTSGLPAITTPEDAPPGTLQFEFLRRKDSGLVYTPQKSTGLDGTGWAPVAASPVVESIDDQWERVVYTEAPDPTPASACFGRVEVSIP
jgi:ELWxxDGT repeat protein